MTQDTNALVLGFDAFEGDFGAPGDRVFSNKMVVARKPGPCAHCAETIQPGERIRRQSSKFDGELMTHRWCSLCCSAMAAYYSGDPETEDCGALYEARSGLRDERALTDSSLVGGRV